MARPSPEQEPDLYEEARRAWQLVARTDPRLSKTEQIVDFLRWAILEGRPGFGPEAPLGVAQAARALGTSRTTVGQAIDRLCDLGLVAPQGEKVPYRVLPAESRLPGRENLSIPDRISITESVGGASWRWPLVEASGDDGSPAGLRVRSLAATLRQSPDPGVRTSLGGGTDAAASRWSSEPVLLFRRLRHAMTSGVARAWLYEMTAISLPAREREVVRNLLESQRGPDVSLSRALEISGVTGLRSGLTRLLLDPLPAVDSADVIAVCKQQKIACDDLATPSSHASKAQRPVLRWEYALFAIEPEGPISFSVCYVSPGPAVDVYARAMAFHRTTDE